VVPGRPASIRFHSAASRVGAHAAMLRSNGSSSGLARAHYRNAPVIIFDEPTAALDPRTEIEIFDRVCGLAEAGNSVILVTHRLASVRRADRIYVLADGAVTESGSHDALIDADGQYAELFRLQARQHDMSA
jgi:ATP-binding cassette, subfamily B, bacterial